MIASIKTTKDKILTKLATRPMTVEALAKVLRRPVPTVRRNCGDLAREGKLERSKFKNGTPTTWAIIGNSSKKQDAVQPELEAQADAQSSAPSVQE